MISFVLNFHMILDVKSVFKLVKRYYKPEVAEQSYSIEKLRQASFDKLVIKTAC